MRDLPGAALYSVALLFLVVFVVSEVVARHTNAPVPKLLAGRQDRPVERRSLIVELPVVIAILGGGQLVVVLFLLDPASTTAVRLVSAAELAAAGVWTWYLWKLVSRRT